MRFDRERFVAFVATLMRAYDERRGIFGVVHHEDGDAVQRRYVHPDIVLGSQEHLARLAVITWFDTMSVSSALHRAFQREAYLQRGLFEFEDIKQLFDERALRLSVEEIRWLFSVVGVSFPKARAPRFRLFAQDFFGELKGDARKIFSLGTTIGEIDKYRRKWREPSGKRRYFLPGYGPKLLSLLALYLYDFEVHEEVFPGAFPADRHLQRLLLQSGVLDTEGTNSASAIAEFLRPRVATALKEMGVPVFACSHAMWLLGSNVCASCTRTSATTHGGDACPIRVGNGCGGTCVGGLSTGAYHTKARWGGGEEERKGDPRQLVLFS
jgi:hypothetical protein